MKSSRLSLCDQNTPGEVRPFSWPTPMRRLLRRARKPPRVTMFSVPPMARAPVSAVGARKISMRSTWSGGSWSMEKPTGARWPSTRICV